ncbi:hypothetical protein LJC23_03450, partial [Desulfovibrio sp. OttesenSCG-928-I05]|nr:hypothetical protein [Desulfovibrio sp. OttesenSCG-928-I05]
MRFFLALLCPPLLALVLISGVFLLPEPADAAVWPAQDIRVTLPFSKGNAIDLLMELQGKSLLASTGSHMIPNHVPGRGGLNAWATMDFSITDGSVLTAVELPGLLLRSLQPSNGLDLKNMALCHISAYAPLALWVPEDSAFASLEDFIVAARKTPRTLQVAGPGSYSPAQIAALRFDRQAGIQTLYMPFMGDMEAMNASANASIVAFWADAIRYPDFTGRYRPLAVAAEARSAAFPDLPTFRELGFELVEGSFRGYVVPLETSKPMRQAIFETFEEIRNDPFFINAAAALGFSIPAVGEAAFAEFSD